MEITEVRIKLVDDPAERLQAFCSVTFDDCFVVRDLKIIQGASGPFVAMPSRKLTNHCNECGAKNHLRADYCNQCGGQLESGPATRDSEGRMKLYADIAHPINAQCREQIQAHVIDAYRDEVDESSRPGYVSRYDDLGDESPDPESDFDLDEEHAFAGRRERPVGKPHRGGKKSEKRTPHQQPASKQPWRNPPPQSFGEGVF